MRPQIEIDQSKSLQDPLYKLFEEAIANPTPKNLSIFHDLFPISIQFLSEIQRSTLMNFAAAKLNENICSFLIEHGIEFDENASKLFNVAFANCADYRLSTMSQEEFSQKITSLNDDLRNNSKILQAQQHAFFKRAKDGYSHCEQKLIDHPTCC